ncbi:carboxypeptidase-like regulatory domain-containing protein [Zeaxanthinibacter sp. PT1]|uniref:carboxypeptidase-like regulatory domain-containing protein n=1 Tax=Zeaxanthinibacter TaxID=561554 RepID=UPI00234AB5FA|nr:carboxypeptidase-like regulatory domain-containing protein [Zeaxanthinibacter sp. PT1]MDC6351610.1 carboxypeptidase-like regulatory domain-containing protein [Zeaxanthinibacter sp. PT1]
MKTLIFTSIISLLLWTQLAGQEISGRILDVNTGKPVAFATIQSDQMEGVISNDEGYFVLPLGKAASRLTISCMGYQTKTLPLEKLNTSDAVILLDEAVVVLDEVMVSNLRPDPYQILRKVQERIPDNYDFDDRSYRLFFRETSKADFEDLEMEVEKASHVNKEQREKTNRELQALSSTVMESQSKNFKDFLGNFMIHNADSSKLEVVKATELLDSKKDFSMENVEERAKNIVLQYMDTTLTYTVKSGIIKIDDEMKLEVDENEEQKGYYKTSSLKSQTRSLFNRGRFRPGSPLLELMDSKLYEFEYLKSTVLEDELIHVIAFRPNRGKSKYSGKFYVNANDYALVKTEYAFAKGKRGAKFNFKLLLGVKYVENIENGTILYKREAHGKYRPSYILHNEGIYVYVHRPFKFIENSPDKNKVRFDFKMAGDFIERSELLISSSGPIEQGAYEQVKESEKVKFLELKKYDPTIWQDAEILQPLQEMKSFEVIE